MVLDLNFSDNSGTTATTLGKDTSGNGNNFTPNNFSVAANGTRWRFICQIHQQIIFVL